MTNNTIISALDEQFKNECEVINLKYEYPGYTGTEQWAIITDLSEAELDEKYAEQIAPYKPFILLSASFGNIRDDYRRNEKKHEMRAIRSIIPFDFDENLLAVHHHELSVDSFAENLCDEKCEKVRNALSSLKPLQKQRVIKYGNKVKLDLFNRFGALGAAGDRHLAEFVPCEWYLKNPQTVKDWQFGLTTVDFREEKQARQIAETIEMAEGRKKFEISKSSEEAVDLMKALLGFKTVVSNVNTINIGQMSQLPLGSIVETNCVFSNDNVSPVVSLPLPQGALELVKRASDNIDLCYEGIKERNLDKIFESFKNQALCSSLSENDAKNLFKEMCIGTRKYLDEYFDIDKYFA